MNNIPHNNIYHPNLPKAKTKSAAAAAEAEKDKPRRPLSAYNLFFRFKRQKILEACKDGEIDRDTVESVVKSIPGLENVSDDAVMVLPEAELEKFRSDRIRAELEDKLTPKEAEEMKARSHRKTDVKHGLSFLEMTKIISSSWKDCDTLSKRIFEDLAEDGRCIRQRLLADYNKSNDERAESPLGGKQGKVGGKMTFDCVRPNAIHQYQTHVGMVDEGASQGGGHNNDLEGNINQQTMDHHMKMMYGNRSSPQNSSAAAAAAAAYTSIHQSNSAGVPRPMESNFRMDQALFNAVGNNPYMPPSYLININANAHSSGHQPASPAVSDKLKIKIVQLEAANESMKKMLEKLMSANADLEGQKSHLIQLVGQLTAENSTLKRNRSRDEGTPSINYHQLPNGFPNRQPAGRHSVSVRSMESVPRPRQERLPHITAQVSAPKNKRKRVLGDPWSQGPAYPH